MTQAKLLFKLKPVATIKSAVASEHRRLDKIDTVGGAYGYQFLGTDLYLNLYDIEMTEVFLSFIYGTMKYDSFDELTIVMGDDKKCIHYSVLYLEERGNIRNMDYKKTYIIDELKFHCMMAKSYNVGIDNFETYLKLQKILEK